MSNKPVRNIRSVRLRSERRWSKPYDESTSRGTNVPLVQVRGESNLGVGKYTYSDFILYLAHSLEQFSVYVLFDCTQYFRFLVKNNNYFGFTVRNNNDIVERQMPVLCFILFQHSASKCD